MRTVSAILVTIIFVCFGFTSVWGGSETEKMQVSAARAWLPLIDSGSYSESWKEASTYFRGAVGK